MKIYCSLFGTFMVPENVNLGPACYRNLMLKSPMVLERDNTGILTLIKCFQHGPDRVAFDCMAEFNKFRHWVYESAGDIKSGQVVYKWAGIQLINNLKECEDAIKILEIRE